MPRIRIGLPLIGLENPQSAIVLVAPTINQPANNTTNVRTNVALNLSALLNNRPEDVARVEYEVRVGSLLGSILNPVINIVNKTTTTLGVGSLLPLTSYFIRARNIGTQGQVSAWSNEVKITTGLV